MKTQLPQKIFNINQHKSALFQTSSALFPKPNQKIQKRNTQNHLDHSKNSLKCGIQKKYLNPINYLSTCQFAKKRSILYKSYCNIIQEYYAQFNSLYQKYSVKVKPRNQKNQKSNFVKEFKSFLFQFFHTFHEVSTVHIGYFTQICIEFSRKQQILEFNTNELIEKLKYFDKSQQQFQLNFKTHSTKLQEIYSQYEILKKDEKDPYAYFNKKLLAKKSKQLLQNLNKQQIIRSSLRKDLDEVYQNSMEFEGNMILYRQQLFANKYKIMKKLSQTSKNSKNSLAELLVYLSECVSRKSEEFSKYIKQSQDSQMRKRSKSFTHTQDKLALQSYLVGFSNDFNRVIIEIEGILTEVAQFLQQLRKFTSEQYEKNKNILELLNTVYDVDQSPNKQIFDVLEFYNYFCSKISELNNGVNIATNQLIKYKNETKKLSQITLSLIRNSKSMNDKSFQKQLHDGSHHFQIQILLQKMSFDYPMNFIIKIYKNFQKSLSYLKNYASQKFHIKKRLVEDSMEISYLEENIVKPQKKICKKQVWLWQKWQDQNHFKIDQFKITSLIQIKEFANKLIEEIPEGKQLDRFSCSLETKGQTSGFLIITDKHLKFETAQGNCILTIMHIYIDEVKVVVKIFGKIVIINTSNGSVSLKGCMDVQKVAESIEDARSNSGSPIQKPPRSVVQISVEQLALMQQRKNKIKSQLPNCDQFIFHQDVVIQNISIDHIYELIYSDKQVIIRGKKQPIFFAYSMKKNGASNYEATKYDTIGPKFYTHEEGVTFLNCPVFSTRIINYDVKLPPIPFMPKYAQNREQCKLFWISNQEFQYLIHNNASGAPKADTFYIQILHKVQKVQQKSSIKISISWKIVFTEDSYLKSTIQSSAGEQSRKGISSSIVQIKRYCNQIAAMQTGESKGGEDLQKIQQQEGQQRMDSTEGNGFVSKIMQKIMSLIRMLSSGNSLKQNKSTADLTKTSKAKGINNTSILLIILTVVLVLNLFINLFGHQGES